VVAEPLLTWRLFATTVDFFDAGHHPVVVSSPYPAGVQMTPRLVGAVVGGYAFTAVLE
jgi:hypothetical protein